MKINRKQETITPEQAELAICEIINDLPAEDLAKMYRIAFGRKVRLKTNVHGETMFVTSWKEITE